MFSNQPIGLRSHMSNLDTPNERSCFRFVFQKPFLDNVFTKRILFHPRIRCCYEKQDRVQIREHKQLTQYCFFLFLDIVASTTSSCVKLLQIKNRIAFPD